MSKKREVLSRKGDRPDIYYAGKEGLCLPFAIIFKSSNLPTLLHNCKSFLFIFSIFFFLTISPISPFPHQPPA